MEAIPSEVYTFGPTFRAENSSPLPRCMRNSFHFSANNCCASSLQAGTTRHLAEFWMPDPHSNVYLLTKRDQHCLPGSSQRWHSPISRMTWIAQRHSSGWESSQVRPVLSNSVEYRFCVSNVLEACKSDVDFFNLRVAARLYRCVLAHT